jgi:hypothetical protein
VEGPPPPVKVSKVRIAKEIDSPEDTSEIAPFLRHPL